jgi:TRAP-type mannitol/chloroaromatic compound transport system substrate-binding protein
MTEQLTNEQKDINDLKNLLAETNEKIDTIRDEILEAIQDTEKELTAQIAQISAFQKNILEANQQKIWTDGIGTLITMLKEATEPKQEETPP